MVIGKIDDSLNQLVQTAADSFELKFGRPAKLVVAAPGRVNLIGEHIDYNDGYVLPMAIDRYTVFAGDITSSQQVAESAEKQLNSAGSNSKIKSLENHPEEIATIFSSQQNQTIQISLDGSTGLDVGSWGSYLEGVISGFRDQKIKIPKFDAVVETNIPVGGGLSSSAAIEVAMATFLETLTGNILKPNSKALLCQKAEHQFAGMPCGIMDQFSSVFGRKDQVLLIDCLSEKVQYVPFLDSDLTILITNSKVQHQLADGQYALRKQQCKSALKKLGFTDWRQVSQKHLTQRKKLLSEVEWKRAKHVVNEILRTRQAANAFGESDWYWLGKLMYSSHQSLQEDYEVSCEELDHLVQIAKNIGPDGGVFGSRMTGGGFGGCTVSLVKKDFVEEVAVRIADSYRKLTGIECESFCSRPADGAKEVFNEIG